MASPAKRARRSASAERRRERGSSRLHGGVTYERHHDHKGEHHQRRRRRSRGEGEAAARAREEERRAAKRDSPSGNSKSRPRRQSSRWSSDEDALEYDEIEAPADPLDGVGRAPPAADALRAAAIREIEPGFTDDDRDADEQRERAADRRQVARKPASPAKPASPMRPHGRGTRHRSSKPPPAAPPPRSERFDTAIDRLLSV